ncbi:hypothetical protein GCM10011579_065210 [Streptomyces albiflavescens]|uniref:Uncharacterized protein n=1 Tax=Streptomyces albiflavescens TaxID=1623582 RepID=A0A918D7J9_9ACTN|nr:hypothetical protein GCM10011579_065210 [Streptomyces albiflavescens]
MPFAAPEEDRGAWEDQEVQMLRDALRPWREKHPHVHVQEDVRLMTPPAALVHASRSRASGGGPQRRVARAHRAGASAARRVPCGRRASRLLSWYSILGMMTLSVIEVTP